MAEALNSRGVEEWRVVPSRPMILASSWGRIMLIPRMGLTRGGKRTRLYRTKPTYGVVTRSTKAAAHSYRGRYFKGVGNVKVHRLVCEAFHGLPPDAKSVVIHINEDSHDNRPGNLRWGTQKENLNAPGFLNQISLRAMKVTPEQARKIRDRVANGEKQQDVAADLGISFKCVSRLVRTPRRCDLLEAAA